jgi:hypothetical protein
LIALIVALAATPLVPQALHGTLEVEYANSDGSFRPSVRWALGDHARAVLVGDVNSDTLPDMLVGYETVDDQGAILSHVSLLLATGTGNFTDPTLEFTSGAPMELSVELLVVD